MVFIFFVFVILISVLSVRIIFVGLVIREEVVVKIGYGVLRKWKKGWV